MKKKIERLSNKIEESNKTLWITYTVLFIFFFLVFWSGFLIHGKTFIWCDDGFEQQYMFFILQGEWFRTLLSNIFVTHTFEIPMWTASVGYGADYFISIGNTFGNPINWISVFTTAENAEYLLNATVPLTLFLAGFAFLKFCLYKKFDRVSSLVGCLVYLFGGFSFIVFLQIYMIYVLILAPLTIYGVEKIFDKKSPFLFIGAMFLNFFYSVDQAYVACLLLVAYCVARVLLMPEKTTLKGFFGWFIKVVGCIALAALLAAIVFLPSAMALVSQGRLGLDRYESATYSLQYYAKVFEGFIYLNDVGSQCKFGFAPIALLTVFVLFFEKNKNSKEAKRNCLLKILFVILTVFLCLPIFGKIFNGFAYPNNRWVWAYCFLVSIMVVVGLPYLRNASKSNRKKAIVAICIYVLASTVFLTWYSDKYFYIALVLLVVTVFCAIVFRNSRALFNSVLILTVALSCFCVSYKLGNSISKLNISIGQSYTLAVTEDASYVLSDVADAMGNRYDQAETKFWRNGNIANGMQGCTFYNSFYNSYVDDYHTSLGLATSSMNFSWATLNSRTTMDALTGVKYFVVPSADTSKLPPLYSTKVAEKTIKGISYSAYQAEITLPLAFMYSSAISEEEYKSYDLPKRQDSLTQSVVLENGASSQDSQGSTQNAEKSSSQSSSQGSNQSSIESYSTSIPYTVDLTANSDDDKLPVSDTQSASFKQEHTKIEGNTITVYEPDTVVYLHVDIPAQTEAYFTCTGMDYQPFKPYEAMTDSEKASMNRATDTYTQFKSFIAEDKRDCKILVYGESSEQEIWYMNNKHDLYGGKHDWMVNIGYADDSRNVIALKFNYAGVYSFDSMEVVAQSSESVISDVKELASNSASNIKEEGNKVTCSVDATENKYLYFRIPYAQGWTATVDGQTVDITKANLGFMAIPVESGHHDITLTYETPYLFEGAAISGVGVVALVVVILLYRKRKKAQKNE
jgi:uncharacterized membrane protein YfhO